MADITICTSISCPIRKKCYRHEANPNVLQSYSNFEYGCNENTGFSDFIKIEGGL